MQYPTLLRLQSRNSHQNTLQPVINDTSRLKIGHARWAVIGLGIVACLLTLLLLSRYLQYSVTGMFILPTALFCTPLLFIRDRQLLPIHLVFVAIGGLIGCIAIPLIVYLDYSRFNSRLLGPIGLGMILVAWPFIISIFACGDYFLGKIFSSIQRK